MTGAARPLLLTPGPLSVSPRVREAMLHDWGSRDPDFTRLTRRVIDGVRDVAGGGDEHAVIPLQGSGTFAVEAMLRGVAAPGDLLVVINGAYGRRMAEICRVAGLAHEVWERPEDQPIDAGELAALLAERPDLTRVAVVHCETTSGLLNPLEEIAEVCRAAGRSLLVDAMSSFGALPLDIAALGAAGVAASSNKCLQGVPGIGLVISRRDALAEGQAGSVVLDLAAQHKGFESDGQWRFTPPTHVVAALAEALGELAEEGGPQARLARYRRNAELLIDGMRAHGFESVLPAAIQAPVIVSFHEPDAGWYRFEAFYDALKKRGFSIYPGKMRDAATFRVGVIGDVFPDDIERFVAAVGDTIQELKGA